MLCSSSCCSWYGTSYAVNFELDRELNGASVELNIIGVTERTRGQWQNLLVDNYFGSARQKNTIDKEVIHFNQNLNIKNLSILSPVWERWEKMGATHIYVIASIPGVTSDLRGENDPRVQLIPLSYCYWKVRDINFVVQSSGLRLLTPMNDYKE